MPAAPVVPDDPTMSSHMPHGRVTPCSWWSLVHNRSRSRFSVAKAKRFLAYTTTPSTLRQVAAVLLFPVPGLLAAVALSFVPLQHPMRSMSANWGIFLHQGLMQWMAMVGGMLQARAASLIDHDAYSTLLIMTIASVASVHADAVFLLVSHVWCFPVPFYAAIAPWAYVVSLVWVHYLVTRAGRLPSTVRTKLLLYVPPLALQVSQLALYPSYSALFTAANEWQQLMLVVAFPCLKFLLRKSILAVSQHLHDFAKEIAVCGVEISASLYQATIMQSTPSPLVTASIIGLDVLVCVVDITWYLDHKSFVPSCEILERASKLLASATTTRVTSDEFLQSPKPSEHVARAGKGATVVVAPSPTVSDVRCSSNDQLLVAQGLEILQAAESVLLVEYLEVSVPLMNACLLLVMSHQPSARYNRVLRPFHSDPSLLGPALASILLYTALQALTFVGMCVVLRVRYRLSGIAFVLEDHAWSCQGKLLMWLPATLSIPIIHYGTLHSATLDQNLARALEFDWG